MIRLDIATIVAVAVLWGTFYLASPDGAKKTCERTHSEGVCAYILR